MIKANTVTCFEPPFHPILALPERNDSLRRDYALSKAKRAQDVPHLTRLQADTTTGKTRITIFLDADVVAAFRERAAQDGRGYQTLINEALRGALRPEAAPLTAETLRQVLREELHAA